MKRRILLVDDELAILLTLKAVLEISGFDVETAASAREAKLKLRAHEYHMVITDMRMESETAGIEVVAAARKVSYDPAIAMLTAFPLPGTEGDDGVDKMLVKPMNTGDLLVQIEALLVTHEDAKRKGQDDFFLPAAATKAAPGRGRKAPERVETAKSLSRKKPPREKLASAS